MRKTEGAWPVQRSFVEMIAAIKIDAVRGPAARLAVYPCKGVLFVAALEMPHLGIDEMARKPW